MSSKQVAVVVNNYYRDENNNQEAFNLFKQILSTALFLVQIQAIVR
ncbi:MAG: hypothetical protein U0T80_08905 [Flavobacteriaceae bacterium]